MNTMFNMNNSEPSAKSKGVVIFAHNTAQTDYVKIANQNARLIEHFLKLPVTIITDTNTRPNSRYDVDTGTFVPWLNRSRSQAYDLSPYDTTLVLDADYIILDDNLNKILDLVDFQIFKTNEFLDQTTQVQTMGKFSLPFVWATALIFKKSEFAKAVFDQVKIIEQNYAYFCSLYNVKSTNYRNDYAFAMALNALSGYTTDVRRFIPWKLMSFATEITHLQKQGPNIVVRNTNRAFVVSEQSLHFISKRYLQTPEFESFVSEVINAQTH